MKQMKFIHSMQKWLHNYSKANWINLPLIFVHFAHWLPPQVCGIMAAPLRSRWAEFYIIPPHQHFVNRHFAQRLKIKFSQNCATFSAKTLAILLKVWYYNSVKRESDRKRTSKKNKKNQKNPLDKSSLLWYNKDTKGEERAKPKRWDFRKVRKTPTDDPTARCPCLRNINVNQTTRAEKMSWIRKVHKPLLSFSKKVEKNLKKVLTSRKAHDIIKVQSNQ